MSSGHWRRPPGSDVAVFKNWAGMAALCHWCRAPCLEEVEFHGACSIFYNVPECYAAGKRERELGPQPRGRDLPLCACCGLPGLLQQCTECSTGAHLYCAQKPSSRWMIDWSRKGAKWLPISRPSQVRRALSPRKTTPPRFAFRRLPPTIPGRRLRTLSPLCCRLTADALSYRPACAQASSPAAVSCTRSARALIVEPP